MAKWLAAVLAFAWTGTVLAQEAPTAQIQLLSFLAPIRSETDADLREAPVTVYLNVADASLIPAICELSPRLRDAFMEALFSHPIPVNADRKLETAAVEPLLLVAANKALRQNVVQGVVVTAGSQRMATGSSRSRASMLGCGKLQ